MQQDRLSRVLLHKLLPSYTKKRKIAAALALSLLFVSRHSFVRPTTTVSLVPRRDDDIDNNDGDRSVQPWTTTHELCTRRQRRYDFSSPSRFQSCRANRRESCVAVVVTVNLGFYDFFVNWYRHYQTNRRRDDDDDGRWLVIIAEDSQIYQTLTSDDAPFVRDGGNVEIVLGDGSEAQSVVAEGFGTEGYRSLVSGRATHLLNVICGLEWAVSSSSSSSMLGHFLWGLPHATTKAAAHWIVIYTDIDAVWLQDPIPMVRTALYNHDSNANDINVPSSTKLTPRYDLVAAVDERHNSMGFETYYCTGFVAFVDTPATVEFLSRWEEELRVKPTFNQPVFNTLLSRQQLEQQSLLLPPSPLAYAGLSETQFVSGKFWDTANPNDKEIVVLHNNFVEGAEEKRRRFREKGLWMEPLSDVSTSSNGVRDEQHPWTQEHYRRPVRVSYVTSFWAEPNEGGGGGGDGGSDEHKPPNPHLREMEAALLVNIHNPHFDQIVVFLDGVSKAGTTCDDFLRHMRELDGKVGLTVLERTDPFSKVSCVNVLGDQPNYFQMFNNTLQEDVVLGDVVVLSNADQAFDDSVAIARYVNPNVLVVLGTRGFPLGEIPPIIQHFYVTLVGEEYLPKQGGTPVDNMCATNPYSWDTWIFDKSVLRGRLKEEHFQRPLANKKMITFSMNEMGAENAALWALQQAFPFSSLYNACDKIRSWSFHLTPKTHKVHETSWLCERRAKYPCGSVPYPWGGNQLKGRLKRSHPGVPKDPECVFANNCFLQEAIPLSVVEDVAT